MMLQALTTPLVSFVFLILFYRPFITSLDKVKTLGFSIIMTILPFIYQSILTLPQHHHLITPSSDYFLPTASVDSPFSYLYNTTTTTSKSSIITSISSINMINRVLYNASLWTDACALVLITNVCLYVWAFLTRWTFPILYIGVLDSPMKNQALRYSGSILFTVLGYLCLNVTLSTDESYTLSAMCFFLLGFMWQYSGAYFYRRRYAMGITVGLTSMLGYVFQKQTHSSSLMHEWNMAEWCLVSFVIVAASCLLDNADAIVNTYPPQPNMTQLQTPTTFIYWRTMFTTIRHVLSRQHLLCPDPVADLVEIIKGLGPASRSWKTMAALFPTNLRQDLCILYGFFRACDDLVDDAPTLAERHHNLQLIRAYFRLVITNTPTPATASNDNDDDQKKKMIDPTLAHHGQVDWLALWHRLDENRMAFASFRGLARISGVLCPKAADDLCTAWKLDLAGKPMATQQEMMHYAALISGKFGELCTCVIMYKTGHGNWNGSDPIARNNHVLARATATGQCLQLVNIARDIVSDSLDNRCYVPLSYMSGTSTATMVASGASSAGKSHHASTTTYQLLKNRKAERVGNDKIKSFAVRILDVADQLTGKAQLGIDGLPMEVQQGIRAAFEIYMAIGPILRQELVFPLRAKVPTWKKQWIALRCIYGFHPTSFSGLTRSCRTLWSLTLSALRSRGDGKGKKVY